MFVDLTEECEAPPLKPYSALLMQVAEQRNEGIAHRRFPIPDVSVPTPSKMRDILDAIRDALPSSETR